MRRICVGLIGLSIFFHLGFTKCGWFEGVVCALGSLYISTKRKKEKKRKKKNKLVMHVVVYIEFICVVV